MPNMKLVINNIIIVGIKNIPMHIINVENINIIIPVIAFLLLFPILDECIQFYTPYRISDVKDGIVDIIGGFTGSYVRRLLKC